MSTLNTEEDNLSDHFDSEIKVQTQARVINFLSLDHFEIGMSKIAQCNLPLKGLGNLNQSHY